MPSGDQEYIKPTWHVYDGCVLKVFYRQDEMFSLEMTPDQATKLATDLLISAQQARRQKPA